MSDFTGLITDEWKQIHTDMITELIRGCAVTCTLIYSGTKHVLCPNCIYDVIGKKSSNRYTAGGPIPFTTGICPSCNGAGRVTDEQTDSVSMIPIWNSKQWMQSVIVDNPNQFVQTLSVWDSTYMKIRRATHAIIDTSVIDSSRNKFVRHNEPQPCGMDNTQFAATMWKRVS